MRGFRRREFLVLSAGSAIPLSGCTGRSGHENAGPRVFSLQPVERPVTLASVPDARPIELGVWFRTSIPGYITGIRFFKGPSNLGPHTVRLHERVGEARPAKFRLLVTATVDRGTEVGWVEAKFVTPVAIPVDTLLCASYIAPRGGYSVAIGNDNRYLRNTPNYDSGPLTAVIDLVGAGLNAGQMASQSPPAADPPLGRNQLYQGYEGSDYLIDVLYYTDKATPPTLVAASPADRLTGVSPSEPVRGLMDQRVTDVRVSVEGPQGEVSGSLQLSGESSSTYTWRPSVPLQPDAKFVVTTACVNTVGQPAQFQSHSFSTGSVPAPVDWTYWRHWENGFPADQAYFPIGVFYQTPRVSARQFAALGINFFNGGRPDDQFNSAGLAAVAENRMYAIPFGYRGKFEYALSTMLSDPNASVIRGINAGDEPDLKTDPPQPPHRWQSYVQGYREAGYNGPLHTNMGRLGSDLWPGYRDPVFSDKEADLQAYIVNSDWLSADYYGITTSSRLGLSTYGTAVQTMRAACRDEKPVFGYVETCDALGKGRAPSPDEVEAAVWQCIAAGARGITYFVQDRPGLPGFTEAGLLLEKFVESQQRIQAVNEQIRALAPVLNQLDASEIATVRLTSSSGGLLPVRSIVRQYADEIYIISTQESGGFGDLSIEIIDNLVVASVRLVLGASSALRQDGNRISDRFTADFQVRGYAIALSK